jgi:hypothetical protein
MALCNTFITTTDTNWIYPIADLQYVINNTSIPLTATPTELFFQSVSAAANFYDQVYLRTSVTQPIMNEGYTLGVGTTALDLQDQLSFKVGNNLYVLWRLVQQLTDQATFPPGVGGNSPNGTIGYLTIVESWPVNVNERPVYRDPVQYAPGPQIECPQTQNTFGLPADTVALVTSRFGSVANFLRLRNQGQV